MDLNKLIYFNKIVECGSFKDASKELHITQPALSKAIKVLESDLNKKLILPSGRGIEITQEGRILAGKASQLISQYQDLVSSIRADEDLKNPPLRIGSFEVFSTHFLGKVLKNDFINRVIEVSELAPGELENALIEYQIDIGITYHPIAHLKLDLLKIKEIQMGIYGSKKYLNRPLDQLNFVAPHGPKKSTPTRVRGLDGWPEQLIKRKVSYQVQLLETAFELCRQNSCVGYFPKFLIDLHNQKHKKEYQLLEIEPGLTQSQKKFLQKSKQSIYLIKRKDMEENQDIKKLAKWIRTTC